MQFFSLLPSLLIYYHTPAFYYFSELQIIVGISAKALRQKWTVVQLSPLLYVISFWTAASAGNHVLRYWWRPRARNWNSYCPVRVCWKGWFLFPALKVLGSLLPTILWLYVYQWLCTFVSFLSKSKEVECNYWVFGNMLRFCWMDK